ncbi:MULTISPECIES: helix-turn-helix domain-containing protein [unclassified Cellulomonas]|uniref:helix-turn-helix domain-containing protein n=1 Tax=unclassified Cellulomonas TaxID=2620175 RepID=UPI0024B749A2|nr:helix-turn-helix domain-containing protein [Cellulomonas sp. ES6]WHP16858.1 helix-turn-helix domain-containing protein [Cellulomonas sp. ES6]
MPDDEKLEIAALGAALKVERQRQRLSVKTLSELSGVSFGLISELERGKGNPSFVSLHRLAAALQVTLPKLLSGLGGDEMVVRAQERHRLPETPGVAAPPVRELLTPRMQSNLQLIRSTLPAGFTNEGRPFRHLGTESVLVEEGRLLVVHGERRVELGPGDAMTYGCSTPHWWANAHDGVTVVLGAVSPTES